MEQEEKAEAPVLTSCCWEQTQISHTLTKKHKHTHIRVPKGGIQLCVFIKCAHISALMQYKKDPALSPRWIPAVELSPETSVSTTPSQATSWYLLYRVTGMLRDRGHERRERGHSEEKTKGAKMETAVFS